MKHLSYLIIVFFHIHFFTAVYGQGKMILIDSKNGNWTDTNIPINTGEKFFVFASGLIAGNQNGENIIMEAFLDPSGMNNYLHPQNIVDPNSPMFALIGKVGTNGQPFYVGLKSAWISPTENGNLYLMVNDCLDCFYDNLGYFSAVIYKNSLTNSSSSSFDSVIDEYSLSQNFPNPFNPTTTIKYQVETPQNVKVNIYDISGQLIKTLVNEYHKPGNYSVLWDGINDEGERVSTGTYFYQLISKEFVNSKKMILLK